MAVALPAAKPHPTGVPRVGDLYWVDTWCYGGNKKETRPVVVVRAPNPPLLSDAIVLGRTSNDEYTCGPNVKHPRDPVLGLNKAGAFVKAYRRVIDVRFFSMPAFVSYQGELEDPFVGEVLRMVGLR